MLSLIMGFLALQIRFKGRPMSSGLLGPPISLLFALPFLRNVQPDVPPFGSYFDILAFYWNMAIVAISSIVLTAEFII